MPNIIMESFELAVQSKSGRTFSAAFGDDKISIEKLPGRLVKFKLIDVQDPDDKGEDPEDEGSGNEDSEDEVPSLEDRRKPTPPRDPL